MVSLHLRWSSRKLVGGIMVTFPVACRRYLSQFDSSVWDDGTGTLPLIRYRRTPKTTSHDSMARTAAAARWTRLPSARRCRSAILLGDGQYSRVSTRRESFVGGSKKLMFYRIGAGRERKVRSMRSSNPPDLIPGPRGHSHPRIPTLRRWHIAHATVESTLPACG